MGDRGGSNRNPCITMHQPWASLLVHGIKRIEGRSWPSPLTGRLWIHAAGKVPDVETIKAMEDFYREIYAVNGITDLQFPDHYPVSRLLGCVDVVGCVKCEELVSWEEVPEGVRLEGLTKFCWLCENPQKLLIPFEMRGYQGVYNLERKIYEAAVRGLSPVEGPLPVKFPLPDPHNLFSLKPGSLVSKRTGAKPSEVEKSPSLAAAIDGARAAATQFSMKEQKHKNTVAQQSTLDSPITRQLRNTRVQEDNNPAATFYHRPLRSNIEQSPDTSYRANSNNPNQAPRRDFSHHTRPLRSNIEQGLDTSYRANSNNLNQAPRSGWVPKTRPLHSSTEQSPDTSYRANGIYQAPRRDLDPQTRSSSKIFATAVRGLRQP